MTISNDPIVIVSAVRTPMGGFQGELKSLTAPQLGAAAIKAAVERAGVASDAVDEVLFGCVLPAGLVRPLRTTSSAGAGLDKSTRCTTVNKMWRLGHGNHHPGPRHAGRWQRRCGDRRRMESMSNSHYLLDRPAPVTAWATAGWDSMFSTVSKTPTTKGV